jgi:signal peptidase I
MPGGKDMRGDGEKRDWVFEEDPDNPGKKILTGPALLITCFCAMFMLVTALRFFVAEPFIIPTPSMADTIGINDIVLGEKVSYRFTKPKRGDIVTFNDPRDRGITLIKRVIATEGEVIDLRNGTVYIDNEALDEPYTDGARTEPLPQATDMIEEISYPYTIPEGHVWVMGDNRSNSKDSRYFGPIPVSDVTTRAFMIYWPIITENGLRLPFLLE